MGNSSLFHLSGQPFGPCLNSFAGSAGHLENLDPGINVLHGFGKGIHIKLDIREEVNLIQYQGIDCVKHQWILEWFVIAFRHAGDQDLAMLAEIKFRRADQITNVFDQ